jgi:uncharacterized Fe-S cluster-containing MiaB family protein
MLMKEVFLNENSSIEGVDESVDYISNINDFSRQNSNFQSNNIIEDCNYVSVGGGNPNVS